MSSAASRTGTTTLARGSASSRTLGRTDRVSVPGPSRRTLSEVSMAPVPVDRVAEPFVEPDLRREAETLARAVDRVDAVLGQRAHAGAGERWIDAEGRAPDLQHRPRRHRARIG